MGVAGLRTTLVHPPSTAAVAAVRAVREAHGEKTNSRAAQKTATATGTELAECTAAAAAARVLALAAVMGHQAVFVLSGVLAQTAQRAASRTPTVQKIRT